MAAAWMPYVFYAGDERSHCGANSIHLVRRADEWRIQHITYTRREDCDVSPEVQKYPKRVLRSIVVHSRTPVEVIVPSEEWGNGER